MEIFSFSLLNTITLRSFHPWAWQPAFPDFCFVMFAPDHNDTAYWLAMENKDSLYGRDRQPRFRDPASPPWRRKGMGVLMKTYCSLIGRRKKEKRKRRRDIVVGLWMYSNSIDVSGAFRVFHDLADADGSGGARFLGKCHRPADPNKKFEFSGFRPLTKLITASVFQPCGKSHVSVNSFVHS